MINTRLMLSTIIDHPSYKNMKKVQKVLDQSVRIRDYIEDFAKGRKRDLYSFTKT